MELTVCSFQKWIKCDRSVYVKIVNNGKQKSASMNNQSQDTIMMEK